MPIAIASVCPLEKVAPDRKAASARDFGWFQNEHVTWDKRRVAESITLRDTGSERQ